MNKINHPWILIFMMICAVVMVWSNNDGKMDHRAAGDHSITNADTRRRQKVLKGLRAISSLRRAQRAKRDETFLYRACVWTCDSLWAGTPGKVLFNIITTEEESWSDYIVLEQEEGFYSGDCACEYFVKPKLTSALTYDLRVKIIDSEGNMYKPQGFAVRGPDKTIYCEYQEQCSVWGETCWFSEENDKRIEICWDRSWPSCT